MTYDVAIVSLITFLINLILLSKKGLPKIIKKIRFGYFLLVSLLAIIVSMILTVITHLMYFPIITTITVSCMIMWKYREAEKEREKEKC